MRDAAALKAVGLNSEGQRQVLVVSVSLSEQEIHWRAFLQRLVGAASWASSWSSATLMLVSGKGGGLFSAVCPGCSELLGR